MHPTTKEFGGRINPDEHEVQGTVIQEIQKTYPEAQLAHRLDKDTSGLLLVAKNEKTYAYLKELFKKREIKKIYVALVVGIISKDEGDITLPITRSTKDFRKRIATPHTSVDARAAETHYKVLQRFLEKSYTLMEVIPKTGRTHQIRSHMASIGHPVACDKLYGGKRYACPAGLQRQFLHAAGLDFVAMDGKRLRLEVDMPEELIHGIEIMMDTAIDK